MGRYDVEDQAAEDYVDDGGHEDGSQHDQAELEDVDGPGSDIAGRDHPGGVAHRLHCEATMVSVEETSS